MTNGLGIHMNLKTYKNIQLGLLIFQIILLFISIVMWGVTGLWSWFIAYVITIIAVANFNYPYYKEAKKLIELEKT